MVQAIRHMGKVMSGGVEGNIEVKRYAKQILMKEKNKPQFYQRKRSFLEARHL